MTQIIKALIQAIIIGILIVTQTKLINGISIINAYHLNIVLCVFTKIKKDPNNKKTLVNTPVEEKAHADHKQIDNKIQFSFVLLFINSYKAIIE